MEAYIAVMACPENLFACLVALLEAGQAEGIAAELVRESTKGRDSREG